MKGEPLRFEELRIRRMPGFENDGFTLRALAPGINLIHGPNGSGKSTTARAIARLLWPVQRDGERISLAGHFRLGAAEWSVDIDGSRIVHQQEGAPTSPPMLPAGEDHKRYHLSLHDLLHEKDASFARAIVLESAGGYDVRATGSVLEPREVPTRRTALNEELDQAKEAWARAIAAQQELRGEELRLRDLRERRKVAEDAIERLRVLEAALEHAEARDAEAHARAELERFPEGMGRVGGKEYEQLCHLRDRLRKIDAEIAAAEEAAQTARVIIDGSAIPESGLREEVLRGLEHDLAALRDLEHDTARLARERESAATKVDLERGRIPGSVDLDRLADLNDLALGNLVGFARRAGEVNAARQALEAEFHLLGEGRPVAEDQDRLAEGIRALQRWLREPADSGEPSGGGTAKWPGVIAALLLAALGVVLGIGTSPWYLLATVVGFALCWAVLRERSFAPATLDARDVHRREYVRLGFDEPSTWAADAVESVLERLQARAATARLEAELARRRQGLEGLRGTQEAEEWRLEEERRELASRLGVQPESEAAALAWVAEAVGRWQAAHAEMVAKDRAREVAAGQVAELAASLRARLEALGFTGLSTTGELSGAIRAFQQRRQALELARQALSVAEKDQRRFQAEAEEHAREMRTLFHDLQLDPDSDDTVRDWCAIHAEYVRARENHRDAHTRLRAARSRLHARGGEEALTGLAIGELQAAIAEAHERGSARADLADQISRTEARVDDAKRSHGIEEALERIDQAREALRRARERDVRGVIATELVDYLERATRDQHLPAVFLRAREIFTRITHGRYELRLRQEGEPEFTAYDTQERRGRALDELSSGTRVQLLLAVRVAFVEQQEHGVMLPLVLDEVLGNSDDERARAIIEAALELAREGRQIFYFTAQADEVARWQMLAGSGETGVQLREIDLLRARGSDRILEIPQSRAVAGRVLPSPDGVDHTEYGIRLEVPRLDRVSGAAAAVHLWYLVEEPETLHTLLLLGTERWGSLDALLRDGGRPLVDDRLYEELQVCGRVLEAFFEAARIGTGRRVDRAVLEDSGAVSTTFIDRVDDLARVVGGDGHRLMEALEEGRVARFQNANKESLRRYLEEAGYLPQEFPLDADEIRSRVVARVAGDVAAGAITLERLDRLVGRLWLGVGGEPC